jgi:hypothetical protein
VAIEKWRDREGFFQQMQPLNDGINHSVGNHDAITFANIDRDKGNRMGELMVVTVTAISIAVLTNNL